MRLFLSTLPLSFWLLAAALLLGIATYLVTAVVVIIYNTGRARAFAEIERRHGLIRGAHAWRIVTSPGALPPLSTGSSPARLDRAASTSSTPSISSIPYTAHECDVIRRAKAHLN